jgi:hypothetical protein
VDAVRARHRWPMSWLYRREGARLLAYERVVARRPAQSFFVTRTRRALFQSLAPEVARGRVQSISNGVDAEYFSPQVGGVSPLPPARQAAGVHRRDGLLAQHRRVCWFVERDAARAACKRWPRPALLHRGPQSHAAGQGAGGAAVVVTGTVPDVRPYLQHAAVVVAPLRVARGIQNRTRCPLEAMADGVPPQFSDGRGRA